MNTTDIETIETVIQKYRLDDSNPKGYRVPAAETQLCQLAFNYGSGKCPQIYHSYTPFYYELFKDNRMSIKKVLEIGVGFEELLPGNKVQKKGASLYMWRDFFPNAQIYGADILPELIFKDERIETFLCDQGNRENLKRLVEKTGYDIDIFIDDGSHNQRHQFNTCLTLMPLLKKGVVYIIEDVRIARNIIHYIRDYYDYQEIGFHQHRHRDDRLIIIKHKNG